MVRTIMFEWAFALAGVTVWICIGVIDYFFQHKDIL